MRPSYISMVALNRNVNWYLIRFSLVWDWYCDLLNRYDSFYF